MAISKFQAAMVSSGSLIRNGTVPAGFPLSAIERVAAEAQTTESGKPVFLWTEVGPDRRTIRSIVDPETRHVTNHFLT